MSVNPGFGGQSFIPGALDKIAAGARARRRAADRHRGRRRRHAGERRRVVEAGANVLVAGSAVFKAADYKKNIAAIRNAAALARGEAA